MQNDALVLIPSQLFAFKFTENVYLKEDTTWTKADSPYVFHNGVHVGVGEATLTVEPGVVVKFGEDAALHLYDSLNVQGSESEPVIFTSPKDDSIAGDTNRDGDLSFPSDQDDWYVAFDGTTQASGGAIEFAEFRYSKYDLYFHNVEAAVRNVTFATSSDALSMGNMGLVVIENISLKNISRYGIGIFYCDSVSMKNIVVDTIEGDAILIQGSVADLENIEISNVFDAEAIELHDSTATITNLAIHDMFFGNDGVSSYKSTLDIRNAVLQDFGLYKTALGVYSTHATVTDSVVRVGLSYGMYVYGSRYHLINTMRPSRGGRLIGTPASMSFCVV